jgi:hypothetical protein
MSTAQLVSSVSSELRDFTMKTVCSFREAIVATILVFGGPVLVAPTAEASRATEARPLLIGNSADPTVLKDGGVTTAWWKTYAKTYTVEVSVDGKTWREVRGIADKRNYFGDMDVFRFDPTPTRYVRLHCTERSVTWQAYTVYELAVYEAIPE